MKQFISFIASVIISTSCKMDNKETYKDFMENEQNIPSEIKRNRDDTVSCISLTVAESKRLIARGITKHPLVQRKLASGMIIITRGSTNTYIAEELTGLNAPHGNFVTGRITPSGKEITTEGERVPEIVIIDGKRVDMPFREALAALKKDDIVFKGGNLLNYEKKQVAVTIGSADGGTVGRIQPYTAEGPAHLIVPIGLEKEVYGNLYDYEKILSGDMKGKGFVPRVIVHKNAEIFTEIEAIKIFGDVHVIPYASGGIAGSEGAKSFAVYGSPAEVEKVLHLISEIQGEPPFIEGL
ncbi:MAG: hypothetical protein LBS79_05210 [Tannerella sp.]|jgi:hypothetical protein|nr:hypothetical protein [Tannerella sp.]